MSKSEPRVKRITVTLHHDPEGKNNGFEIDHSYEDGPGHTYIPSKSHGVMTSHGAVMTHMHEHIKDHGSSDDDCASCDSGQEKVQEKKMDKKHPGFKAVEKKIASKEGLSKKAAGAILAARSRSASASAHKANPHLNKVKG